MITNDILVMLDKVKSTGSNQWSATCPNEDHRNAKLGIKDTGDSTLIKCWGGCSTLDVIGTLGLSYSDLYHEPLSNEQRQERRAVHSREELKHEATIVWMAYHYKLKGILKPTDRDRANQAYKTLREAEWL
jgi:hypothetical protein